MVSWWIGCFGRFEQLPQELLVSLQDVLGTSIRMLTSLTQMGYLSNVRANMRWCCCRVERRYGKRWGLISKPKLWKYKWYEPKDRLEISHLSDTYSFKKFQKVRGYYEAASKSYLSDMRYLNCGISLGIRATSKIVCEIWISRTIDFRQVQWWSFRFEVFWLLDLDL